MSVKTSNVKTLVDLLNDKSFRDLVEYRQMLKMSALAIHRDYIQRRLNKLNKTNDRLLRQLKEEIDVIILRQDLNNL